MRVPPPERLVEPSPQLGSHPLSLQPAEEGERTSGYRAVLGACHDLLFLRGSELDPTQRRLIPVMKTGPKRTSKLLARQRQPGR